MIFGIKTKKDKKIEELQKEIERLREKPFSVAWHAVDKRKVLTYHAEIVTPLNSDVKLYDYAIRELARKMEDAVKSNLEIKCIDDPVTLSRYYGATLNIVEGRNWEVKQ